jgi:hypothetical protein
MSFLSTRALGVVASTVPANGDVNPYGVAVSPKSFGKIHTGDILVSNFNNSANLQGPGTTIVDITPGGTQTLFAAINPVPRHSSLAPPKSR